MEKHTATPFLEYQYLDGHFKILKHFSAEVGLCRAENFPDRPGPGQKIFPKNRPGPGRAKTCFPKNRPGPKRAEKNTGAKKGQKGPNFFGEYKPKCAQKIEKLTNVPNIY